MPAVYLFLGSSLQSQIELAEYLSKLGLNEPSTGIICLPERDQASTGGHASWTSDDTGTLIFPPVPEETEALFLLTYPSEDPRPLLEDLAKTLKDPKLELARVFTIVDCQQLSTRPELNAYYELCLHFSDVFLLANRAGVSKKWVQAYIDKLKKMAVPTRIEYLKAGGKVEAVSELLFPEARRISQIFDPEDSPIDPGLIIENLSDEDSKEAEEEPTEIDPLDPENDPFLSHYEDGSYEKKLQAFPEYPE